MYGSEVFETTQFDKIVITIAISPTLRDQWGEKLIHARHFIYFNLSNGHSIE